MDTQNQQAEDIHKLVEEGKLDEAKVKLKEMLSPDLSKEEKGGVLAETALVYMDIMTEINDRYIEMMQERLKELEEINGISNELSSKVNIAKTREEIKSS